jgi:hypothetical protein
LDWAGVERPTLDAGKVSSIAALRLILEAGMEADQMSELDLTGQEDVLRTYFKKINIHKGASYG